MGLSKQQKKALKEAKQLEKLKAEEEARRKLKIQELQRELVNQAKNRLILEQSWRNMLLKVKLPVYRQDIEVMWHVFERALDKKDHLLRYTIKLVKIANDQFSRTISSFCVTVDTMINKFLNELDEISKENERQTNELLNRADYDVNKIKTDHDSAETHLQLLIYHGHTTADANAWSRRGDDLVKQDEEENKYASVRESLRSDLENIYNNVWDGYKNVLRAYVVGTVDNLRGVRKLRKKENLMAAVIASQGKRIANNDNVLKVLRSDLQQYESGTKQIGFRERRERHRAACHKLKTRLVNGCAKDTRQLAVLVKATDDTIAWLSAAHEKGERMLKLAALCRRHETQKEKVLPFGCQLPQPPTELDIDNINKVKKEDSLVLNAMLATMGINRLWQRIAKAELSRKALLREKKLLEKENMFLSKYQDEVDIERKISVTSAQFTKQCDKIIKCNSSKPVAIDGTQAIKYYNFK